LSEAWRIWVDTGGTFTDAVGLSPAGERRRVKILSTGALRGTVLAPPQGARLSVRTAWSVPRDLVSGFRFRLLGIDHWEGVVAGHDPDAGVLDLVSPPEIEIEAGTPFEVLSGEEAPLLAARMLTATPPGQPLPPCRMRLATTLGTNALLQRAGVPTALFITQGFGDLPRIGTQQRPDLFTLDVRRPEPLHDTVVEVPERLAADGSVLVPLDAGAIEARAAELLDAGTRVAAVALMHAHRNPRHEQELKQRLLRLGFEQVSCSAELAPRIKLLPRAQTAVVDAYLSPVVRTYLDRVASSLPERGLLVMTSAGGLLDPDGYRPKDSLLSGPAGGVVGGALAGRRAGCARTIGLDMGGTSTDVARFDGDYEYQYQHRVGDVELVAPALSIETVAAGGGSVCWLDGSRLRVGPRSAGARPGPACYGAGGPLTLTDVNLLLGRLDPDRFEIPVSVGPARARLDELLDELARRTGERPADEAVLAGLLAVANETMADAIRRVSLRRGYDPTGYALVAFGGAGGQHACGVASCLGIGKAVVPPDAALLSALGLGRAVLERFVERQVLEPLARVGEEIAGWMEELGGQAVDAVVAAGAEKKQVCVRRRILHLRFAGQESSLEIDWTPDASIIEAFERRFRTLYGHRPENREVELESLRVVASTLPADEAEPFPAPPPYEAEPPARARASFADAWQEVPAFAREELPPGATFGGPALVLERHSATAVEPGWRATVDGEGALILEQIGADAAVTEADRPEAIRLELFTQRFFNLVKEMGDRLERTAVSTNVKERLDFSCALLDPDGELVANAPHIPVHLGALGLCVRHLAKALPLRPGDVAVTNHPSFGGSHLPDVTVVTPVFAQERGGRLLGYVASRAHHAEIGGSLPGSVVATARTLVEEGVVIPPSYLIEQGEPRWDEIRALLLGGPHPTRNVEDNLADLRAAAAANHAGAEVLRALAAIHGEETVLHYMERLERLAESRIREALRAIPDGTYEAEERLDDGTPLRVKVELSGDQASIDFSGTAGVHPGNLNATPAIVHSAVIYVLRLLIKEPLPLNEGLLRAVSIRIPPGLLDPPFPDDPARAPAVVGGNVETSQRLVDTLLKALGLAACSQGTMNNLVFGNQRYAYYETLGGGCGAGPDFDGASAVHSHMTNTRITDPEILEHRYPVRVERFAVRRDSGGSGERCGGDGLVRELTFLEPASLSVLTQHRVERPYGLEGGEPGAPGAQRVVRAGGGVVELGPVDGCEVQAGDRLIVETPGGGGCGM
jgi:5-oxoprolinase (ATP-hydrolysing)